MTLHSIPSNNSRKLFRTVRTSKSNVNTIDKLEVDGSLYNGSSVPDGFFESVRSLRVERIYALPILLSGVAPLVLS